VRVTTYQRERWVRTPNCPEVLVLQGKVAER
jgi:hypothetical protein